MKHRLRKALIAAAAALPIAASTVLVGTTGATAATVPTTVKAAAVGSGPAIFLTPHQDDETLSMGAAVREHVLAGRDTWVILLTDGSASGVCQDPPYNGDKAACVAERDKEYRAAVNKMGAHAVILADRKIDNALAPGNPNPITRAWVESVIQRWAASYPGASFKTMSERDDHVDHKIAGQGLYDAYVDGYAPDARWYVKRYQQQDQAGSCTSEHNLNTAATLYHPIGWDSVPTEFNWIYNTDGYPDKGGFSKAFGPSQRGLSGPGYDSKGYAETCWWPQITPVTGATSTGTR